MISQIDIDRLGLNQTIWLLRLDYTLFCRNKIPRTLPASVFHEKWEPLCSLFFLASPYNLAKKKYETRLYEVAAVKSSMYNAMTSVTTSGKNQAYYGYNSLLKNLNKVCSRQNFDSFYDPSTLWLPSKFIILFHLWLPYDGITDNFITVELIRI